MDRRFKRTALIFEIEIFCNIINVFNVTFDQFNASFTEKNGVETIFT